MEVQKQCLVCLESQGPLVERRASQYHWIQRCVKACLQNTTRVFLNVCVCVCACVHAAPCVSVPELQLVNFISSANIIRRVAYLFYISTFLKNSRSCLLWLGALTFQIFWYGELTFPLHYFFHYVTAWWKALISTMVRLSLITWSLTYN